MNPLLTILPSLIELIRKFIPDRAAQDAAVAEISQTVNAAAAQVGAAMLEDAKSTNWFQAGWRPALGWVCVAGLSLHYLLFPLAGLLAPVSSPLDVGALLSLVMALLGLGGLRTVERIKGRA